MYQMSKPRDDDVEDKSRVFFKEDLETSARYRQDSEESGKRMQVRFDGPLVLARSICGTRTQFQQQFNKRIQSNNMAQQLKKAFQNRKSTMGRSGIMSQLTVNKSGNTTNRKSKHQS